MTWAELIREYYKLCMESGCAIDLGLESEPGAHFIWAKAHRQNYFNKQIIGYVGLGMGNVEGRMISYDDYKDPDLVIEQKIKDMVTEIEKMIEVEDDNS